ncbi:hypothetical protein Zmor_018541 [Zophobas morio]|uniref:Membrane protein BRI3 n=1 Tax=Zophobas morio TaxID=2755281 RepID=A0AA38IEF0_9CUCU|nr:hypothetical protein Zmor_018541 [Zophobas morio]
MEKHEVPPPYNHPTNYDPYNQPQAHFQNQQQFHPQQQYHPQQNFQQQPPSVISTPPVVQPHLTQVTVNTAAASGGGSCPVCHVGHFESSFTLCGWLCCIFCFPVGIICCLCMRKKECSHCGFSVS